MLKNELEDKTKIAGVCQLLFANCQLFSFNLKPETSNLKPQT
jgi:hypothetical protein